MDHLFLFNYFHQEEALIINLLMRLDPQFLFKE